MRTWIFWISQIGQPAAEFSALGRLKIPHILTMRKMASPLFLVVFGPIILILAGNYHPLKLS